MHISPMPEIHAGMDVAAGAASAAASRIRMNGGLLHDSGKGIRSIKGKEMTLAMIIAIIIVSAEVVQSATVVAIGAEGPVWSDMMTVAPHTDTVVMLLMPEAIQESPEITAGCSIFEYVGARALIVVPKMEPYDVMCYTLTARLEEVVNTLSFAANTITGIVLREKCISEDYELLPLVRTQAALYHLNGTMCFTAYESRPKNDKTSDSVFTAFIVILYLFFSYAIFKMHS